MHAYILQNDTRFVYQIMQNVMRMLLSWHDHVLGRPDNLIYLSLSTFRYNIIWNVFIENTLVLFSSGFDTTIVHIS
jgi:hypothetical protein